MATDYFLISLPYSESVNPQPSAQFNHFQQQIGEVGKALRLFGVPSLKVGTLDTLMEASDELTKVDPQIEASCYKLAAMLEEASGRTRASATMLRLSQQSGEISCENYLKAFAWNAPQFDVKETIHNLIQKLVEVSTCAEERVRTMLSEYNEVNNKLTAASRRGQGNLAVKPIGDAVKQWCQQQHIPEPITSEFLATCFVAVPITAEKEWLSNYSTFHEFVCPQSSSVVTRDPEYALFSVVLFKKALDDFKMACRKHKFVVREFEPNEEITESELQQLRTQVNQQKSTLIALLTQQFTLCYVAWVHVKAIRVFVESLLKYGLPPRFIPILIAVDEKREAEVRGRLRTLYSHLATPYEDDHAVETGALQYEYPYVSIKVANILAKR